MADNSITVQPPEDIDKAAKWTVFLLVDLRVIFIITYVYVSVVNLISTTANGEATEDIHSTRLFTVTSHPDHADVNVSFIDDAILWSCRDHSVTKHYYRGLYWMLISAFSATMVAYILTKITIIFGAKHGHLYMWKLSIIECLQQLKNKDKNKNNGEIKKAASNEVIENAKKILDEKHPLEKIYNDEKSKKEDIRKLKVYDKCRIFSLCLSVVTLFLGIILTFLFYDLHPISCIRGQGEKYIDYDETNESVRIHFSNGILLTQKIVGVTLPILAFLFVINAFFFYYCNIHIIKIFAEYVKTQLQNNMDETDSSENKQWGCCDHIDRLGNCLDFYIHK